MAKLSVTARNKKRQALEEKYRAKRAELKDLARQSYVQGDIPWDIHRQLQEMPRNSNFTRVKRRCQCCSRPRSIYRKFGLCRLCLRKYAMMGYVPGLVKASW